MLVLVELVGVQRLLGLLVNLQELVRAHIDGGRVHKRFRNGCTLFVDQPYFD